MLSGSANDQHDSPLLQHHTQRVRGAGITFEGRGIPYVETFAEQKIRELWEDCTFQVSNGVVNSNIIGNIDHSGVKQPLLKKIMVHTTSMEESSEDLSGYENMFDPLYDNYYQFHFPVFAQPQDPNNDSLKSFCLRIGYRGDAFCGWQTQRNYEKQPSVQKTLETYLDPLFQTKKGNDNNNNNNNKYANLPVAGRTDAGVHAIGQICRFRTHRPDISASYLQQYLSERILEGPLAPFLQVTNVIPVSRAFHPTFSTSSRAYVYLIDVSATGFWSMEQNLVDKVSYLNALLGQLEGKELNYFGLSYGKPQTRDFLCIVHHARACLVKRPKADAIKYPHEIVDTAICIELVGNRFLRRMVRLMVQASMCIVANEWYRKHKDGVSNIKNVVDDPNRICGSSGLNKKALLQQVLHSDRSLVSRIAPPNGLIFVGTQLMDKF